MSVELFYTCGFFFRIYTMVVNFLMKVIFLLSLLYEHFMICNSYGIFFWHGFSTIFNRKQNTSRVSTYITVYTIIF